MSRVLDVRDLRVAFGDGRPVVDGASFDIGKGEIIALVGESGSGKTIAARALLGLLPFGARIAGGEARFEGRDLLQLSDVERQAVRGSRIGMIFQEPMTSLNPSMTVGRQVAEGLQLHEGLSDEEARARSVEMLERVRIKDAELVLDRYPHQFSGGMRQRIMIASAMLLRPALILADEPTTALDVLVQKEVLEVLVELARDAGSGVLLITHDLGLVAEYASRIFVMRNGQVVESGSTGDLLQRPREDYTRRLLAALPHRRAREQHVAADRALVSVENVSVCFAGRRRLPWRAGPTVRPLIDVTLAIRRGETLALVGESGSGKTTLARSLLGLAPVSSGRILFDGTNMTTAGGAALRDARRRIRIVFQDPFSALDPRMRIGEIIAEGLRQEPGVSATERKKRVSRALDEVGLGDGFEQRFPHQLSGGQRQRVNIARALIANPELVIADEPVSALDVTVQAEILELLERLQAERGFGCMFISHSLGVVEQVADRVAVIYRGRIVEQGDRDAIFDSPAHPYTQTLLKAAPRLENDGAGGYRLSPFAAKPAHLPPGFDFVAMDSESPTFELVEVSPGHMVACSPAHPQNGVAA